jgi:hypothetical protein
METTIGNEYQALVTAANNHTKNFSPICMIYVEIKTLPKPFCLVPNSKIGREWTRSLLTQPCLLGLVKYERLSTEINRNNFKLSWTDSEKKERNTHLINWKRKPWLDSLTNCNCVRTRKLPDISLCKMALVLLVKAVGNVVLCKARLIKSKHCISLPRRTLRMCKHGAA